MKVLKIFKYYMCVCVEYVCGDKCAAQTSFVAINNSMLVDKLGPNLKTANNLAPPPHSPILAPLVPL